MRLPSVAIVVESLALRTEVIFLVLHLHLLASEEEVVVRLLGLFCGRLEFFMEFVMCALQVRCLLLFSLQYLDGAWLVVCKAQLPSDCGEQVRTRNGLVVVYTLFVEHRSRELRLLLYIVGLVVALCEVLAKQLVLLRHALPSCED